MGWRRPGTAPRDGTFVIGLFEDRPRRARRALAAFDVPDPSPVPEGAPSWVREGHEREIASLATDPVRFFRPVGDDDREIRLGRMVGWKPVRAGGRRA